jgi:methyl-accepting chemotaxis protein
MSFKEYGKFTKVISYQSDLGEEQGSDPDYQQETVYIIKDIYNEETETWEMSDRLIHLLEVNNYEDSGEVIEYKELDEKVLSILYNTKSYNAKIGDKKNTYQPALVCLTEQENEGEKWDSYVSENVSEEDAIRDYFNIPTLENADEYIKEIQGDKIKAAEEVNERVEKEYFNIFKKKANKIAKWFDKKKEAGKSFINDFLKQVLPERRKQVKEQVKTLESLNVKLETLSSKISNVSKTVEEQLKQLSEMENEVEIIKAEIKEANELEIIKNSKNLTEAAAFDKKKEQYEKAKWGKANNKTNKNKVVRKKCGICNKSPCKCGSR